MRFQFGSFAFNRWYRRFAWFPEWTSDGERDQVLWLEQYYECTQSNGIRLIRTSEEMQQAEKAEAAEQMNQG